MDANLKEKDTMKESTPRTPIHQEWEQRTLCSDDNCIGIIGPDGRCKECGKPYEGGPGQTEPTEAAFEEHRTETSESEYVDTRPETPDAADGESITDDEWGKRTLCSDENCIGVIGPDGRCGECGKPYQGR